MKVGHNVTVVHRAVACYYSIVFSILLDWAAGLLCSPLRINQILFVFVRYDVIMKDWAVLLKQNSVELNFWRTLSLHDVIP